MVGDALVIGRPEQIDFPTITMDIKGLIVSEEGSCVTLNKNDTTLFYSSRRALVAVASQAELQQSREQSFSLGRS